MNNTFTLKRKRNLTFKVRKENENYIVEGPLIENLIYRTNFEVYESVNHLQKVLEDKGVIQQLKDLGIQDGDNVVSVM